MLSKLALKDVMERMLRTALQAFLGVYGLDLADVLSLDLAQKGATAAGAAVLAALMGLAATRFGSSKDDASVR